MWFGRKTLWRMSVKVFVYGTLMTPSVRYGLLGRQVEGTSAILQGFKKVGLNIIEASDEQVAGQIIEVTTEELERLDRYESVSTGLYKQITVNVNGEDCVAYQKVNSDTVIMQELV